MLPQEVITSNRSTTFPFLPLNTTVRPICMARSYLNASIIIIGSLIVSASINAIGSLFLYVSIIGTARSGFTILSLSRLAPCTRCYPLFPARSPSALLSYESARSYHPILSRPPARSNQSAQSGSLARFYLTLLSSWTARSAFPLLSRFAARCIATVNLPSAFHSYLAYAATPEPGVQT